MCGRFGLFVTSEELAHELGSKKLGSFTIERRYNIAPGQWFIVVRPEKNERVPALAKWGLVPSWYKDPKQGPNPINARADKVLSSGMYRGPMKYGRCIVPASGFYEWKKVGASKVPHFIKPKGTGIFIFAGLSSQWAGPDGELETAAIITTEANSLMKPLHDRMPVILPREVIGDWLDPENKHPEDLLVPCSSETMLAWPVSPAVNTPKNDSEALIEPVHAPGEMDGSSGEIGSQYPTEEICNQG